MEASDKFDQKTSPRKGRAPRKANPKYPNKVIICLPPKIREDVDRRAEALGMNRSRYIQTLLTADLYKDGIK